MNRIVTTALALAAAALVAGCAAPGPTARELDQQAQAVVQASFREQGIARLGLEGGWIGEDRQRGGLAIEPLGIGGEEACDQGRLRGPGVASPEQDFAAESAGAHDEDAANGILSRRLLREGRR